MTCLPDGWLKEVHHIIRPVSLQVGSLGHSIAKTKSRNNTGFRLSSNSAVFTQTQLITKVIDFVVS